MTVRSDEEAPTASDEVTGNGRAGVAVRTGVAVPDVGPADGDEMAPPGAPGATPWSGRAGVVARTGAARPGTGAPGDGTVVWVGVAVRAGIAAPDVAGPASVVKSIVFAGVAVRTETVGPGERKSDCEVIPAVFLLEELSPDSDAGTAV